MTAKANVRKQIYEIKDGKIELHFHQGQIDTWDSEARFVFMLAGSQGGKCVERGTLIHLADGTKKPIEYMRVGDYVLSLNDNHKIVPNRVSACFDNGYQFVYALSTASGRTVHLTAEHPLLGASGWSPASTFRVGDSIAVPSTSDCQSDVYWDTVADFRLIGLRPVHDITVENGHNFIAQDVFCHNTSFGPWWLNREIVRCGSGDYLAVAPTYDLFNLKMLPEMLNVFVRILGIGKYWPGIGIIELCDPTTRKFLAGRSTDPMWGRIIMRSASAEGGLESATAKAAWLDEVGQDSFPLEAWEAVLRRLSLEEGRVLGTTTIYNTGWLKQQIYTPWLAGDRDYAVIQFASINNPLFPRTEFLRAKRTMPAWKFAMFYLGQFSKPPGLIYSDYIEDIHKIPDFPIPVHWPRYVGVDFGAVNQATVWIAQHPVTKACYLYRESLEGNKTSSEHAEGWKRLATDENVVRWVGGAGSEKQVRADLNASGIPIIEPPIGGVEPGIDRVIALFKAKQLFVFESCTGVRDELGRYSRDISKSGDVLEEIKEKNKYHRLDALRYAVTTLESATGWENIGDIDSGATQSLWSFLKN